MTASNILLGLIEFVRDIKFGSGNIESKIFNEAVEVVITLVMPIEASLCKRCSTFVWSHLVSVLCSFAVAKTLQKPANEQQTPRNMFLPGEHFSKRTETCFRWLKVNK